jgi:inosose dehydratase
MIAPAPHARSATDAGLPRATLGIVPLLFANDDLPELTPPITSESMLDEIARLGFAGTQLSRVLPRGPALRAQLAERGLRIAEVYATLPCTADGPPEVALAQGREKIRELNDADGEILILSYHLSAGRAERAGRALGPDVPRLSQSGFEHAVRTLHQLASEARRSGYRAVYHPHVGTFIETPDEVERLMSATDPDLLGLCLDTGHYTLGGGDAVQAIRQYRSRLRHVHLKDVSASAMSALRKDPNKTFLDALRERIFTELGDGVLDVVGVARALVEIDYEGWLMSEQDTSWWRPSESAAISRRVWSLAVREAARAPIGVR